MKVKSFQQYLEKRLDKKDIADIEKAAKVEFEILSELQNEVAQDVINFMSEKKLGFNDIVSKLGKSPTQVSNIIKGKANLTMATIAQIYAMMGKKVHIAQV
jgi:antitoxin component HigA of HigAB toxin-antitoxin module